MQKGISYLMLKCKSGCKNTHSNIRESLITEEIQKVLDRLCLTDNEKKELEADAVEQLNIITDRRNREMTTTYTRLDKIMKDLDYLCKEKLTFLRDKVMSIEEIKNEEIRLHNEIEECQTYLKQTRNLQSICLIS